MIKKNYSIYLRGASWSVICVPFLNLIYHDDLTILYNPILYLFEHHFLILAQLDNPK